MDPHPYLRRIGYAGDTTPSPEVLSALQRAHLLAVPFENLDISNGTPIVLTQSYEKVVVRRRGGFCFELNGAFYGLLESLGFEVWRVSASVNEPPRGFGPEYDHMAILARFGEDRFLVDVGFGAFAMEPLRLAAGAVQDDAGGRFRIDADDERRFVVSRLEDDGTAVSTYRFTDAAQPLDAFEGMCLYHQTSPDSPFTRKQLCTLATPEGRITLTDGRLRITENGNQTETALPSGKEVRKVLKDLFGMEVPGHYRFSVPQQKGE